jgi:hypothetical protein
MAAYRENKAMGRIERRRSPRIPMVLMVVIKRIADHTVHPGLLVDFSPDGTRILTKAELRVDDEVDVLVVSREGTVLPPVRAKVVWEKRGSFRYGFQRQYGASFLCALGDDIYGDMLRIATLSPSS